MIWKDSSGLGVAGSQLAIGSDPAETRGALPARKARQARHRQKFLQPLDHFRMLRSRRFVSVKAGYSHRRRSSVERPFTILNQRASTYVVTQTRKESDGHRGCDAKFGPLLRCVLSSNKCRAEQVIQRVTEGLAPFAAFVADAVQNVVIKRNRSSGAHDAFILASHASDCFALI